jgi:formate hydrogenlyase subunit 3/multisubunit Na+/H+ antiporter MnhD subunit
MNLFLAAVAVLFAGALVSATAGKNPWANAAGPVFAVIGSSLALAGSVAALAGHSWEWMPFQAAQDSILSIHLVMDPLSAFFCAVTGLITGIAAVYGHGYLKGHSHGKNLGASWGFYLVLTASMLLVETARDGVLFLVAWEIMSLSSFFLVIFEGEKPEVLKAGWIYLVATHFATAFLMVMFMILGSGEAGFGSFAVPQALKSVVFILAVVGFGTKAGIAPFHVWLPEAHPAAPSHVSAVMSGVMVKAGIYGILRICTLLGVPELWWGWLLVTIGAVTGVGGVLFALAQKDLKRLLAYSTVENIGIIALGMGLGLIGISTGHPVMAALGIGGGLVHVLNHAVFKSLLFFGAGSVLHATGGKNMENMGGLMKRMGKTGSFFMLASAAICALPPLNGFVGEYLIYLGSFKAFSVKYGANSALAGILVISALALIGGLAAACFTRAAGVVFLGEPRTPEADKAHESSAAMTGSMGVLAVLCMVLGVTGPYVLGLVRPVVQVIAGRSPAMDDVLLETGANLFKISLAGIGLVAAVLLIRAVRSAFLSKRAVRESVTWDCGYTAPNARMQYTASSFSDPVITMFNPVLRSRKNVGKPVPLFPLSAAIETKTPDVILDRLFTPVFVFAASVADRLHRMKKGFNQVYILYIVLTLFSLLVLTFFKGHAR